MKWPPTVCSNQLILFVLPFLFFFFKGNIPTEVSIGYDHFEGYLKFLVQPGMWQTKGSINCKSCARAHVSCAQPALSCRIDRAAPGSWKSIWLGRGNRQRISNDSFENLLNKILLPTWSCQKSSAAILEKPGPGISPQAQSLWWFVFSHWKRFLSSWCLMIWEIVSGIKSLQK